MLLSGNMYKSRHTYTHTLVASQPTRYQNTLKASCNARFSSISFFDHHHQQRATAAGRIVCRAWLDLHHRYFRRQSIIYQLAKDICDGILLVFLALIANQIWIFPSSNRLVGKDNILVLWWQTAKRCEHEPPSSPGIFSIESIWMPPYLSLYKRAIQGRKCRLFLLKSSTGRGAPSFFSWIFKHSRFNGCSYIFTSVCL